MIVLTRVLALMVMALYSSTCHASGKLDVPTLFRSIAITNGLPEGLLYGMALNESGTTTKNMRTGKKRYVAWPWTLNYQKKGYYFNSREDLYQTANRLLEQGAQYFDLCPMQVNWGYHSHRFKDLWDATNPTSCITAAAQYLKEISKMNGRANSWTSIVGGYHNFDRKIGDNYAQGVRNKCSKLKLSCYQ